MLGIVLALVPIGTAEAEERLCDSTFEDCRAPIIALIRNERVGIDVSYWFMNDTRYSSEIIKRWQAGVPVRILLDLRADANYPSAKPVRDSFVAAGIPVRLKFTTGINHWKTIIYAGQHKVHFSAANFANGSYSPIVPYREYVDEAIYFTDDPDVVETFKTKYDDLWTDTAHFANFANVSGPLLRNYPTYRLHPDLNFPPDEDYQDRLIAQLKLETRQIDAVMFRITSAKVPDELISRFQAGVPVRLITEERQYRNSTYLWHSYNVDRMYMAGIPIKWKVNDTEQDMHQKSVALHGRGLGVIGSSNWTTSSSETQREHNYFTKKAWFVQWLKDQFWRKWNNVKAGVDGAGPIDPPMIVPFAPLPPDAPEYVSPSNGALGQESSVTLKWEGGDWAHKYDIYFGTSSSPPRVVSDFMPGSATAGVRSAKESFVVSGLAPGTTYYWKIVGKTMADKVKSGPTWSFTTSNGVPPPAAPSGLTGTAVSPTRIDLSWNDVSREEGYKIERKLSSASTWTQIGVTAANAVVYQDTDNGLTGGTTYNYRVRAYTSGGNSGYSNTVTVTTPSPQLSAGDIVLYAADAAVKVGSWGPVNDSTAAGNRRLENPYAGAPRNNSPLASPIHYFEMSFNAQAGRPYRLWIRGKAYNNSGYNDSVYAQFSRSVSADGTPVSRIGTTSGWMVNIEECSGCGLSGWGWQDNGFGTGALGPEIYFAASGAQTIRIQVREDGLSIDQIVISPDTYRSTAPGALKLDTTILPKQGGTAPPPPPSAATIVADAYVEAGSSASTNFGASPQLITKFSSDTGYERESYLKVDISGVQSGNSVRLRLLGQLSDTREPSVTTGIYLAGGTSWSESTITWNTRPAASPTRVGTVVVSGTTPRWYEVDLTSAIQAQKSSGKNLVTLVLKNSVDTLPYASFSSRETADGPQILLGSSSASADLIPADAHVPRGLRGIADALCLRARSSRWRRFSPARGRTASRRRAGADAGRLRCPPCRPF